MFAFFADRDGKFQLLALAESAFDPLSRTTRFMLTEEAHHMFVGETGVLRIVDRTAKLMAEHGKEHPDQVRALGVIDLPTMQRYLNLWYSLSLDLFGGEISSNAAGFFAAGLKGRPREEQYEDHRALAASYALEVPKDGRLETQEVPLRNAMNEVLRDAYVEDCQRGVDRWNRAIAAHGVPFELRLPSRRFHRRVGLHAGTHTDPSGAALASPAWEAGRAGVAADAGRRGVRARASWGAPSSIRSRWPTGSAPRGRASRAGPSTSSTCGGRDSARDFDPCAGVTRRASSSPCAVLSARLRSAANVSRRVSPRWRPTSTPPSKSSTVGAPRTRYFAARPGDASMSTAATFHRPAPSAASPSRTGSSARHGGHHAAPNSTRTGTSAASTSAENVSSSTVGMRLLAHGVDLHAPERSRPRGAITAASRRCDPHV